MDDDFDYEYERFEFCQREIETKHIYSKSYGLNGSWVLHKGYTKDDRMLIEPPEHTIGRLLNSLDQYINELSGDPSNTENKIKEKLEGKNLNLYTIYYLSWKPNKKEYADDPWEISDQTNQGGDEQDTSWKIEIENKNATVTELKKLSTQNTAALAKAEAAAGAQTPA